MTRLEHWFNAQRRFDLESKMGNSKKASDAYVQLCRATTRLLRGYDFPHESQGDLDSCSEVYR